MKEITCKRCGQTVPDFSCRNNKVWGRICAKCSKEIGQLMNRSKPPFFRMPQLPEKITHAKVKKIGMINRIVNRLFRRRGVQ